MFYFLGTINRFAHWLDLILVLVVCRYLFVNQFNSEVQGLLLFIVPCVLAWLCFKYELKVWKSKGVEADLLNNQRVILFEGGQGKGKSSFAYELLSNKLIEDKFTNSPVKINGKYTYKVSEKVLNLDEKINDYSAICLDEATLYFNNLATKKNNSSGLKVELYSQEVLTQLVRHFYDGWVFYMSVDCTRLPKVIEENASCRLLMLGVANKKISFLTSPLICALGKIFGIRFHNGLKVWKMQQFININCEKYNFDLSTQTLSQENNRFANLIEICAFDNPYKVTYNDRFMRGLYEQLPEHNAQRWDTFLFDRNMLKYIGYGEIVEFFDKKTLQVKNVLSKDVLKK